MDVGICVLNRLTGVRFPHLQLGTSYLAKKTIRKPSHQRQTMFQFFFHINPDPMMYMAIVVLAAFVFGRIESKRLKRA
jgi:hypothetical protein